MVLRVPVFTNSLRMLVPGSMQLESDPCGNAHDARLSNADNACARRS